MFSGFHSGERDWDNCFGTARCRDINFVPSPRKEHKDFDQKMTQNLLSQNQASKERFTKNSKDGRSTFPDSIQLC
jgi:hypothetical protein